MTDAAAPPEPAAALDPTAIIKSKSYVVLLLLGALIGVPVATVAYFFLDGVSRLQNEIFNDLPNSLGFHGEPLWWPLPWLALSGILVALAIRYLPGTGGHEPSEGFKSGGPVPPIELFGIVAAAFATLSLGVVLGPEAPLIAIGSGLGVLAVHLFKRDAPAMAAVVIGAAGSFAAIATLLGSPLVGAFLLMEMAGLGGPMMEIVLVPGLLSAGVGSLDLRGSQQPDGIRVLLPDHRLHTARQLADGIRVPLGHRHRPRLCARRLRHLSAGGPAASLRRTTAAHAHPCGRPGGRRARHRLRGRDHARLFRGALLRSVGVARPRPERSELDGWRPGAPRRLQGAGLFDLAERISGRTDFPEHVHRRGGRHRAVPRGWAADDRGCGHGRREPWWRGRSKCR